MQRKSQQENSPPTLNPQEQLRLIRMEQQRKYKEQWLREKAKTLFAQLLALNDFFEDHVIPTGKNTDIFSSGQIADRYHYAVIELQPKLQDFLDELNDSDIDLNAVGRCMLENAGIVNVAADADQAFDLAHLNKLISLIKEKIDYVVNHINDRDSERQYHDKSIIVEIRLIKETLHSIMKRMHPEVEQEARETDSDAASLTADATEATDDDMAEPAAESNAFLLLPDEVLMNILETLPLTDLLNSRLISKTKTGVVDAVIEFVTRPGFIIRHLSHLDGIAGHQFTAFYQRTRRYQDLKRKVLAKEPLTNEEAVCYTLTRDCAALPDNLNQAMESLDLDDATRQHLELILLATKEIDYILTKTADMRYRDSGMVQHKFADNKDRLLSLLNEHHPQRFVNLLAGVDFSYMNLAGIDFSHLNLGGVILRDADLTGANLSGACLTNTDLTGALLRGIDLSTTDLGEANFSRANLAGSRLCGNSLRRADFEWAFIHQINLLDPEALHSVSTLRAYLRQFQKNISQHSPASQRKLQEQMLREIAAQIEQSDKLNQSEKIALLGAACAIVKPAKAIVGIFPFYDACQELKSRLQPSPHQKDKIEHPLKKEAAEILERIFKILNGTLSAAPAAPVRQAGRPHAVARVTRPEETRINGREFSREFKLLLECIHKDPSLNSRARITEALGISAETWHLLCLLSPVLLTPTEFPPSLVDTLPEVAGAENTDGDKRYASEVFDGAMFDIRKLQKIGLQDLESHLYEEEDFVIFDGNGRTEVRVKLGDLFITYCPGGKGSVSCTIAILDFEKRECRNVCNIDLGRYGSTPFEAFVPLDPYVNYGSATCTGWIYTPADVKCIAEAYALKKQLIEHVFASERINRAKKLIPVTHALGLHSHEGESHLASLPIEVLELACAYVYADIHKNKKGRQASPLAAVRVLSERVQQERSALPLDDEQEHSMQSCEKGKEKVVDKEKKNDKGKEKEKEKEKENRPASAMLAAPKGRQGLFAQANSAAPQQSGGATRASRRPAVQAQNTQGPTLFAGTPQQSGSTSSNRPGARRPKPVFLPDDRTSGSCLLS
ncbi:Secreted effector protein pipB2 [Aquicella siphonis]|uniref:Secreted effector protein pipB2 n=1 Tax=Aquicella siphonis TaxID=254247 RepID=A0A5E4PHA5_9COXI|nr:pentapeptide repeat-containing protein [Aquicella siphonis]VVC75763.1 Secreted effector protein pipB2 [Aquicella siphonis]